MRSVDARRSWARHDRDDVRGLRRAERRFCGGVGGLETERLPRPDGLEQRRQARLERAPVVGRAGEQPPEKISAPARQRLRHDPHSSR
jgi:hypothetical protein